MQTFVNEGGLDCEVVSHLPRNFSRIVQFYDYIFLNLVAKSTTASYFSDCVTNLKFSNIQDDNTFQPRALLRPSSSFQGEKQE